MNTPQQPPDFFPAVHSIVEGATLGQLVDRDFGLRASGAIHLIQSGLNDHYALGSPQGDFVIRVYRRGWRSNEAITWELGLIDHVARRGAPVAECVRWLDGRDMAICPAATPRIGTAA
jgi:Ser/Thr protein kinase RdoA (MazF antagonist)